MKMLFSFVVLSFLWQSCSTSISVSQKKIYQTSKFDGGLQITRIRVDSVSKTGKPEKYQHDDAFTCLHIWSWDYNELIAYFRGESKQQYLTVYKMYDSLKKFDKVEYRGIDTIYHSYSTQYLAAGPKRSKRFYELQTDLDVLKYRNIKPRYRKTIFLTKQNRSYRWFFEGHPISEVKFIPNEWYAVYWDCSFGLLTSARCTLLFRFDEHGKLTQFRERKINEGPY